MCMMRATIPMKYAFMFSMVLLTTVAPVAQAPRPAPAATTPKLVVLISVDQMRADYVDRFRHQWTKGLRRLVTEGAWFREADYPYYNTVTCAGHASMSTGTVPAVHGMVLNQWWERNNTRLVACTDDDDVQLSRHALQAHFVGKRIGPQVLRAVADEMRLQGSPAPKVVSI